MNDHTLIKTHPPVVISSDSDMSDEDLVLPLTGVTKVLYNNSYSRWQLITGHYVECCMLLQISSKMEQRSNSLPSTSTSMPAKVHFSVSILL